MVKFLQIKVPKYFVCFGLVLEFSFGAKVRIDWKLLEKYIISAALSINIYGWISNSGVKSVEVFSFSPVL